MSAMCTQCHEREAVVRLTQVQDDQMVTLRLCERCAAERGVETGVGLTATPLGGFLAALGSVGIDTDRVAGAEEAVCPGCGATMDDFRVAGRLGCAGCWDAFSSALVPLVRRLHGSIQHTGEQYQPPGDHSSDQGAERRRLVEQLGLAIATENFELAAELRDQLRGSDK